jgi:superfamily II DNA/RNA helicase
LLLEYVSHIDLLSPTGKTLAYLLPVTERLWKEPPDSDSIALILTPTRELAAQVAGIATVLAPPGTVRLVSRPSNLCGRLKQERGDVYTDLTNVQPRIYVGSATAIQQSLYGDGKMPAPPTSKPEAMWVLQNTNYLVLDEVDRLLGVVGGLNKKQSQGKKHEKPAAVLTAAVTRLTLGKAVTVAASATVGRPLKRELARCMGLTPQESPPVIRGSDADESEENDEASSASSATLTSRAVTIPDTVKHCVVAVTDGSSPGKILTSAYTVIQSLSKDKPQRILLVLTRNFGISTKNAIGALKHFQCQPEPTSLLDALEADGTEAMMELHRQVTGASGVGGSSSSTAYFDDEKVTTKNGYLLVTGEDTVRGLHLDGLDVVLVAGRPVGPDEYTHIAGRTGRAGRSGSVVNIVSDQDADKLVSWEKMLGIQYERCDNVDSIGLLVG